MPMNDDAERRTARGRSQSRVSRYSGSSSRTSTDSYGRARQDAAHLSQTRYARQANQANRATRDDQYGRRGASPSQRRGTNGQTSRQRRDEEPTRSRRSSDTARTGRGSRYADSDRSARTGEAGRRTRSNDSGRRTSSASSNRGARRQTGRSSQGSRRQQQHSANRQPSRSSSAGIAGVLQKLPSFAVPAAIAVIGIIIVLVLIFAVLVPSCSSTSETSSQQVTVESASGESQAAENASGESQAAETQTLASIISQAKSEAQTAVETANQVGSLETSNSNVEALVSLLGEEETAKLISQVKTNPEALWIAAHPDEYAFDGIEVQYKILKLAADEPAAISYVRQFPAKYPMNDASTDKELAMSTDSPSSNVPSTNVPHLYQWDRRWAYTVYSSATFGLTGCGPTSLAMVYQGLNRTDDKTPHDMAVMAEERGYMSEYNGTDSAFLTDTAGELGMNCWEIYPDGDNIRDELSNGHVIIANLGAGYFTTNGHFFVLAGLTDDGQVIINDPYSVERSSQTWDADFIAGESIAMWSYSKA